MHNYFNVGIVSML